MPEQALRRRMQGKAAWRAAEYVVRLKRWLQGDLDGAAEAYRRCLQIHHSHAEEIASQKWAQEDLRRRQKYS